MFERWVGSLLFALLHQDDQKTYINPGDADTWPLLTKQVWVVTIMLLQELVFYVVMKIGHATTNVENHIPRRGKHLDVLGKLDIAFICFNKSSVALMTYHFLKFAWLSSNVTWALDQITLVNTAGAMVAMFVAYDFTYTLFHMALHQKAIYKFVHKHHHQQRAPSRGNLDAVNVHPFEFVTGEYNHLLAAWFVSSLLFPIHAISVLLFLFFGGLMATLNHTRFDIRLGDMYQVRYHDIHHWYPNSNYGQYTMTWDHIFGSFKPYPEKTA
eukprot:GFYU01009687.1.p1 GENE.GFYU01009687.1~~GFYU01009687.1.p1  ORF type:complete len:269 (+),score=74.48 GFYU01009687.1:169-975(+)